ncbi:LPXTG cell wall anchor domain-containing protein, partial [Streptococcus equi]|uniref:LPXTG cell wall anchor domain-containing protein n=1 Tax=Streptococcus equi TaxID=1336 RepID=UPI0009558A8D
KAEIEQKTKEIEALKQGMQSHQGQEKPKDPKTPETPKDPKTPEKNDQPQAPEKRSVPWTALTPAKPIDTTKAPKSSAPSPQTGAATPKKQLPATGDTATPSFFTAAAMAVLASVCVLTLSPRRKKNQNNR